MPQPVPVGNRRRPRGTPHASAEWSARTIPPGTPRDSTARITQPHHDTRNPTRCRDTRRSPVPYWPTCSEPRRPARPARSLLLPRRVVLLGGPIRAVHRSIVPRRRYSRFQHRNTVPQRIELTAEPLQHPVHLRHLVATHYELELHHRHIVTGDVLGRQPRGGTARSERCQLLP